MKKEDLVITATMVLALQQAGVNSPSFFSYYKINGAMQLQPTADNGLLFIAAAYNVTELMDMLPGGLDIDKNTYLAKRSDWKHPTRRELHYPHAHLHLAKTPGGAFVTAYYHFNNNIAFRKTDDGKAVNLICMEENPAESLAQMALALIKEDKLSYSKI